MHALYVPVKLHGDDLFKLHVRAVLHGLLKHPVAKLSAGDGLNGGEVLHQRGPGDLPAEGVLFNDEHGLSRAARVCRGSQPRGPAADDDDIVHIFLLSNPVEHTNTARLRPG